MIYVAYFIVTFSIIQLLVALTNLLFSKKIKTRNVSSFNGLVSVLIPARNEERNIANLLHDLQNQEYRNIEILVFNDLSTDKTEEIVQRIAKDDSRIRLLNSEGLPNGWLGKNFACHCLSTDAKGDYLLFLDADVRVKGAIILQNITLVEKYSLGLLSIFPKQKMQSLGEYVTVPNMNYILLSLLPLVLVLKSKFASLAAANGQFMLFKKSTYFETLPHEKHKNNMVEDIAIARYFKQNTIPMACLLGDETIQCRMYGGFNEAVNGFSKNVVSFFGNSFFVATMFWLVTTFGVLAIFLTFPLSYFLLYLVIIFSSKIVISIASRQNIIANVILFIPQQLALGFFIVKALTNKVKKENQWKGRNIL